jgi:hypothetical protein
MLVRIEEHGNAIDAMKRMLISEFESGGIRRL